MDGAWRSSQIKQKKVKQRREGIWTTLWPRCRLYFLLEPLISSLILPVLFDVEQMMWFCLCGLNCFLFPAHFFDVYVLAYIPPKHKTLLQSLNSGTSPIALPWLTSPSQSSGEVFTPNKDLAFLVWSFSSCLWLKPYWWHSMFRI